MRSLPDYTPKAVAYEQLVMHNGQVNMTSCHVCLLKAFATQLIPQMFNAATVTEQHEQLQVYLSFVVVGIRGWHADLA